MAPLHRLLNLARTGDADARAALFSLPLPRGKAGRLVPVHPCAGTQPLAWWTRDTEPRRMLTALAAPKGKDLPEMLRLKAGRPRAEVALPASPWIISTHLTTERLPFVPHKFADIDCLRGVPAADCTTLEYALDLTYGGRTLRLQPGATGPGTAECLWQNVQIDRLWRNTAAEAVRVGGIIYNEDTYLWADLYLILFANGVVSTTLHFTNTKLHIKGYDFRGFPYLKIASGNASGGTDDTEVVPPLANPDCLLEGRAPSRPMRPECREKPEGIKYVDVEMPRDGWRHDLGAAAFNFADTAVMCGKDAPATLRTRDNAVYYTPFERIVNPQKPDAPADLWEPGFARTLRFQFSLSKTAPTVARYVVPAWWYGVCGEPWPGGLLPVRGRFESLVKRTVEQVRGTLRRGAFDGGSAPGSNRGETGYGLMQQAYLTGDPDLYRDALEGCTYWADRAVDHTDYTAHHLDGAWGWKTCAYTKFRDVLFAYLETGDPWMRDTVELTAESYYAWFRSNWPRNTIGRDAFEVGAWALLWRFLGTEHARDRLRELVRMIHGVLASRGVIGGQMGAGPHPGWHASLYMTGVTMISLVEALDAEMEAGENGQALLKPLQLLHAHYMRDDVEMWPVSLGRAGQSGWLSSDNAAALSVLLLGVYAGLGRRLGFEHAIPRQGFAKLRTWALNPRGGGRQGDQLVHPAAHDALMAEARVAEDGKGVDLTPAFGPATLPWPERQTIETPWGSLEMTASGAEDSVLVELKALSDFRVRIQGAGGTVESRSCGTIRLPGKDRWRG